MIVRTKGDDSVRDQPGRSHPLSAALLGLLLAGVTSCASSGGLFSVGPKPHELVGVWIDSAKATPTDTIAWILGADGDDRTLHVHVSRDAKFEEDRFTLRVACSKGTYIRTLAEDIGAALGCGAHLCGLRRTGTGTFQVGDAVSIDELAKLSEIERDGLLRPPDSLVTQLPMVLLDQSVELRFCQGQAVATLAAPVGVCRVYGADRRFLGLAEQGADGRLSPKRLLGDRKEGLPTG